MARFILFAVILILALITKDAAAQSPDAVFALHVKSRAAKAGWICLPSEDGGEAPTDLPCSAYSTEGDLNVSYDVYLVVGQLGYGIAAISCGIDYDPVSAQGVDIIDWTRCNDGLEFPSTGPTGAWPEAGSGVRLTWLTCQDRQIAPDGIHAIAGSFYVYAYSPDSLAVTENIPLFSGPELIVGPCSGREEHISPAKTGIAAFSAGASSSGRNPCLTLGAVCDVAPPLLDFGNIAPGDSLDLSFTISNVAPAGAAHLQGSLSTNCEDLELVSGGGPYDLAPGEFLSVTVRFVPLNPDSL